MSERFAQAAPGSLGISLTTWGELCFGADKSNDPKRAHERLARFVADVPVHIPGSDTGLHYGEIRTTLKNATHPSEIMICGLLPAPLASHSSATRQLVTDHIFKGAVCRAAAYRELFRYELEPGLVDEIRRATNGNYALGMRPSRHR